MNGLVGPGGNKIDDFLRLTMTRGRYRYIGVFYVWVVNGVWSQLLTRLLASPCIFFQTDCDSWFLAQNLLVILSFDDDSKAPQFRPSFKKPFGL